MQTDSWIAMSVAALTIFVAQGQTLCWQLMNCSSPPATRGIHTVYPSSITTGVFP